MGGSWTFVLLSPTTSPSFRPERGLEPVKAMKWSRLRWVVERFKSGVLTVHRLQWAFGRNTQDDVSKYGLFFFLSIPISPPCYFPLTSVKKEFIGPGLHLRPVHGDHARPPFQWTLNSVFSAYENNNRRIRPPQTGEPWRSYLGYSSPKRKHTLITPSSIQAINFSVSIRV